MLEPGAYPGLRLSLLGGEALPVEVARDWARAAPNSAVENVYGPTEMTVLSTVYRWDERTSPQESQDGIVPIGYPLSGMKVLVVNEGLREVAPGQVHLVALVLHVYELAEKVLAVTGLATFYTGDKATVLLGLAESVDAGDRSNYEHVAALEEGAGGGMAELVDFLVNVNVFLDIGIGAGDVGLRLVVVVVADEVLHGVVGEELLEFGGELGGQRLVVTDDQRRPLRPGDDIGHGEGLAAAGDAEQGLVLKVLVQARHQPVHRLRLVAGHFEIGDYLEPGHTNSIASGGTRYNVLLTSGGLFNRLDIPWQFFKYG